MSLHLMRAAHRHPASLPGPGDFAPPEPVEGGLEPCGDCDGDGCLCCDDRGYFYGDQPMTAREYERFVQGMREDSAA